MSEPNTQRMSNSSQLVAEIASYSDDGSSSIEPPVLEEEDDNEVIENANGDNGDGNDHAAAENRELVPPTEPAQEQRVPSASRVAARLKQAKNGYIKNAHRTNDLLPLQREYGTMKRSLRSLLDAATAYCEATKELGAAQTQFISEFEGLADKSPLQSFVMREHGSLIEVQEQASRYQGYNIAEYQHQILAYIDDWLTAVSKQLDEKLETIPKLRAARYECENKMEKLSNKQRFHPDASFDQELADATQQEMYKAIEEHDEACSKLCYMLEQIVRKGWKDLYPLVNKMMKWELNQLGRENKSYGQFLPETLNKLSLTTIASLEDDLMKKNELEMATNAPGSFYGNVAVVEDYLDYLPQDLPHLFLSDACPYSQMAWIAFLEKERNPYTPTIFQMHYVCNFLKYKDPGYKVLSKLGIVDSTPVLLHKGNVFQESTSLLEYIDACFPESSSAVEPSKGDFGSRVQHEHMNVGHKRLVPSDPIDTFNMNLFLDRYADLPKLYRNVLEHRYQSTTAASSAVGQELLERLEMINADLRKFKGPFLCGYPFSLADIFLIPFVERIQVVLKHYREFEIPTTLTNLHSWYKVVSARSSVRISMADRTKASLHTCAMTSVGRTDYLIEYNEAAAQGDLALAHRLFAEKGSVGGNPYRSQETNVTLGLGEIPMEDDGEETDDREFLA
ncbi:unnamed protein product [Cylindrotheca closterium]|uniref:GST C-terminal domain-containing protein n=1 Tax=Cylindrotheca closterium TaxID=2856 RepID=A0AAD2GAP5_9STRA|nr:unnamed protein product [Cylindrotheca closterium]